MRLFALVLSGIAVVAVCSGARGNGSIDTTGAVITLGVAPDQGTLTTDAGAAAGPAPAIPSLASLGTLGTFSSPLPAFPGAGTGADGDFDPVASLTLPGGTYNYAHYHVEAGVEVTYSGAVTILATEDVYVEGTVTTNSAGASIVLRCARNIEICVDAQVRTLTSPSPVTLDAGHQFIGTAGASVTTTGGRLDVTCYGLIGGNGNVGLPSTTLRTFESGGIRVRAAGSLTTSGAAFISSYSGGVLLQAFGGDATFGGSSRTDAGDITDAITVEASGSVVFTGDGTRPQLYGGFGLCTVKAFGGDAAFLGATRVISGPTRVAASGNVRVTGTSIFSVSGDAALTAFGGDVRIEPTGGTTSLLAVEDLFLGATGNVVLSGDGTLRSGRRIDLRAPAGGVSATTGITVGLVIDQADAVSITAGAAGIDLGAATIFADAALDVTAIGPVVIGGALTARSHLTVTSCAAGVDLSGADLHTITTAGVSGDITVQSFGDAAGVIVAADATFETDAAATKSGDVNLIVRLGKTDAPPAPMSIDAFLLPKSVTVKTNTRLPAKSRVTITGFIDEGSGGPDYAAASTLEVGRATFPITGMTAKGRSFEFAAPGILFRVAPARSASSRGTFLIVRTADLSGEVDKDGELRLRLFAPGFDAVGVAKLVAGKFKLGKVRGAVVVPSVYPSNLIATLRGPGQDRFALVAGFELAGYPAAISAPEDVPSLTIAVGGTFTATIDAAAFVPSRKGDKLTFRGNVNGITSVVLDLRREKISVKGSKMTLAGVAAASGPLAVTLSLETPARGLDTRTFTVSLNLSGSSLKY